MSFGVIVEEGYTTLLDAFTAALIAQVYLYTNEITLTPALRKEQFVKPIFTGYDAPPLLRWTPARLRDGRAYSTADPVNFRWQPGPVPLPVRGCYIMRRDAGPVLWAWRRPLPAFQFDAAHTTLTILVTLIFPAPPAGFHIMAEGGSAQGSTE